MSSAGLSAAFERVLGPDAIARLVTTFAATPVVLLAGDQGSGKSTAAKRVADALEGAAGSTGALVRQRAVDLGIPFAELNAALAGDPDADVRNDYLAAQAIARGSVVVFESRLAGHLGAWLRALGRQSLVSVYLVCPPEERARRVLERDKPGDVAEVLARDATDRARIRSVYGIDYRDTSVFDAVLDTSLGDPATTAAGIVSIARTNTRHERTR